MLLRRMHNVKLVNFLFLEFPIDIFGLRLRMVNEARERETADEGELLYAFVGVSPEHCFLYQTSPKMFIFPKCGLTGAK